MLPKGKGIGGKKEKSMMAFLLAREFCLQGRECLRGYNGKKRVR